MEVRRLGEQDAPAYRALRLRALREHPEAFTSSHEEEAARGVDWYAQRLGSGHVAFWGAFGGGPPLGVVGLEREQRAKARHKATVVGMYVAPEHAGRGVARALLGALLGEARSAGLELLVLTVTEGNTVAQKLYERCGFRSFGIEPRALKVAGQPYSKNHMYLELVTP